MRLDRVVNEVFKPIRWGHPKAQGANSHKVFKSETLPEGWERDLHIRYAGLCESGSNIPGMFRIGKAHEAPPVVEFCRETHGDVTVSDLLPFDVIGTQNIGLPPMIAAEMQKLRDGEMDEDNPEHVADFQNNMYNTLTLFFPTAFGKIIKDVYGEAALRQIDVQHVLKKDGKVVARYDNIYLEELEGMETKYDEVRAIGGAVSRARIVNGIEYDTIEAVVEGTEGIDLDISFLAIHRAGMLPCIIGQHIAEQFGMRTQIVGVDAKRKSDEKGKVTGVMVQPPAGYTESDHSELREGAFVFPTESEFGKGKIQVHMAPDPMHATGVTGGGAVQHYMNLVGCKPREMYAAGCVLGSYDSLKILHMMGANALMISHDQAVLNSKGYIQPGWGDAGKRLSPGDVNDTLTILKSMFHLASRRHDWKIAKRLDKYCTQITGVSFR
jgi:hypothetical protein